MSLPCDLCSLTLPVSGRTAGLGAGDAGLCLAGPGVLSVSLDGLVTTGDWPLDHPHPEQRVRPGGAHQGMPGSDWLTGEILGSDWARPERGAGR